MFNGTGANVRPCSRCCRAGRGDLRRDGAHQHRRERGAGARGRAQAADRPDSRRQADPELVDRQAWGFGDEHRAQPGVVSITQSTELGTVYSVEEIRAVADHAHGLGLTVHIDGSRLANAAAALDVPMRALTSDVGVDVLSLGGTKNGLLGAEAVVVLDPEASAGLTYLRKVDMQLSSKMRFMSAQLLALFDRDLWLRYARHANGMAQRLYRRSSTSRASRSPTSPQANAVFAVLPPGVADRLRPRFRFYDWNPATGRRGPLDVRVRHHGGRRRRVRRGDPGGDRTRGLSRPTGGYSLGQNASPAGAPTECVHDLGCVRPPVPPRGARSVEQIPDGYTGGRSETRTTSSRQVRAVAPHLDTSDPRWLRLDGPDHRVEIALGKGDPGARRHLLHHRRRGGRCRSCSTCAAALGLTPFDTDTGEVLTASSTPARERAAARRRRGREPAVVEAAPRPLTLDA